MILENAPVFSAAGFGLSALYNVDFFAGLSHLIPSEGTWQGSRKSARSLYIDNYNNSFSILITTNAGTVRCPGYSQGVVALLPGDDVTVTSESAAVVSMTLFTEQRAPGFTSRGVAPLVPPVAPFTVAGTISITANNRPDFLLYNSFDTMLYCVCVASKLVIKIDPLKNEVLSATPISKTVSSVVVGANGAMLFGTNDGNYIVYDTVTGTESAPVKVDATGGQLVAIGWNVAQSKVYAVSSSDNLPFNFAPDGSGISAKIGSYAMNKLRVDPTGDVFGIYTGFPYNLTKIVTGASSTTVTSVSLGDYPQGFAKLTNGNLFIGFNGVVRIYAPDLSLVSSVFVTGQYARPVEIGTSNGRVYVGNSTGTIAAIDSALRGVVGNVPNIGSDVLSLTYAENSRKFYAGTQNGVISYINNV